MAAAWLAFFGAVCIGLPYYPKKIIEYGWDVRDPVWVAGHIRQMEQLPFDGLIMRMPEFSVIFCGKRWSEEGAARYFKALRAIRWDRFTDNFLCMYAASRIDFFDDEQWATAVANVRLVARAARAGRCVGLCFDPEPYGPNPWKFPPEAHPDISFREAQRVYRLRGRQFMEAILSELPDCKLLTFFQLSIVRGLARPMDPPRRDKLLAKAHYALLPAFIFGMLDACNGRAQIIDGNEGAYYYWKRKHYFDAYHYIRQQALTLVPQALWPKYRKHMQVGQALYIDQYFGKRSKVKTYGHFMSPDEQLKWFEHNCYWALWTTDEYVWCYSERMNWWTNQAVPPGLADAITRAKAKVLAGRDLGFEIDGIIEKARRKMAEWKRRSS